MEQKIVRMVKISDSDSEFLTRLEGIGFGFGLEEEIEQGYVLVETILPEGWTWHESKHPYLRDPRGNIRSFCDWYQGGYCHWFHRCLSLQSNGERTPGREDKQDDFMFWIEVLKKGRLVHKTRSVRTSYHDRGKRMEDLRPLYAEAEGWMNEHYPNWHNVFAYWDE